MVGALGQRRAALSIVEQALDLEGEQRQAFLDQACHGDGQLLAETRQLLALSETPATGFQTGNFAIPVEDEPLPDRVGPFRILREIARGGMGAVVEGERDDGVFQQRVAIKLIRGDLTSPAMRARFAEERRILARLQHPGIVRIIDGGEAEGRLWLAMDFVNGEPIEQALDHRRASHQQRVAAFEAVCEALSYAHRQLVVHGDIKPSNVLLDEAGQVHLLDFGIGRLIVDEAEPAAGEAHPLTRGYAAPERLGGAPPTVAGDVFGLGMLLVRLMGGAVPGKTTPCIPGTRLPQGLLDGDLAAIAAKALAIDPKDRYPDVSALLADLENARTHRPVSARTDQGWRYFASRFILRHRRGLAITTLIGAGLVAATTFSTTQYFRAQHARAEADARFADARGTTHYLLFELIPRLENQPRSLRLRADTADVAERYLNRLAAARQASDDVRIEAATGLWRLAQYQASWSRPHLNQPQRAEANLARADELAGRIAGGEARKLQSRIRIDRVLVATAIQTDLPRAEVLATAMLASLGPDAQGDAGLRIDADIALANLRDWQARYDDVVAIADRALARLPASGSRDNTLRRLRLIDLKGDALFYLGRKTQALAVFRENLSLVEAARARWPQDNYFVSRLDLANWEIGTTLLDLKRVRESAPPLDRAVAAAEQALTFDPDDAGMRRNLRVARNARAQQLGLVGRIDEALAQIRQSIDADHAGMKAQSDNTQVERDFVFDHALLGEALDSAGRRGAACAADRETLDLYTGLARRGRQAAYDMTNNIKLVRERIARNCPG